MSPPPVMGTILSVREAVRRVISTSPRLYEWAKIAEIAKNLCVKSAHDQDYHALRSLPRGALFVDVGANFGQSACSATVANDKLQIVSFEPNPACENGLRVTKRLLGRKFDYFLVGIGQRDELRAFYLPQRHGLTLTQEGSFAHAVFDDPAAQKRIGKHVQVRRSTLPIKTLDSFALAPSFIKIDVQGLEAEVLRGAANTIARHRPIIMIESSSRNEEPARMLERLHYEPAVWSGEGWDSCPPGDFTHHLNLFWLPR